MGKRELLLVGAFVLVGIVTYQLTAPAAEPSQPAFSLSRIFQDLRGHITGTTSRAERRLSASQVPGPEIREIRIADFVGSVQVIGEDRTDVSAELRVEVMAADVAEAQRYAAELQFEFGVEADGLTVMLRHPPMRRRPRADLILRVPRGLRARVGVSPGPARIEHVTDATIDVRGDVEVSDVEGQVDGTHRNGNLKIARAGLVKVAGRQSEMLIEDIRGEVSVEAMNGDVRIRQVAGEVRIDGRRADFDIEGAVGEIHASMSDGRIELRGVQAEVRIEGRRTDVVIVMTKAATVRAATSDNDLVIALPAGEGVNVRASASDGEIEADAALGLTREGGGEEPRVFGSIAGGGPEVILESTRGDIQIRTSAPGTAQPTP